MDPHNNEKKQETIRRRQAKEKKNLLERLKQHPVVAVACRQAGVSPATYYRWRRGNWNFAQEADEALREGKLFTDDLMEWVVIEKAVKEKSLAAAKFWLTHRHEDYKSSSKWEKRKFKSDTGGKSGIVRLIEELEKDD